MTKYNLPEEVVFCSKCVQSNQRPNTSPELKNPQAILERLSLMVGFVMRANIMMK